VSAQAGKGEKMPGIFLVLALLLTVLVALLYFASSRKLLNFVDYGSPDAVRRLNRYAAGRLLLPVCVNAGCAYLAAIRPGLTVPLIFLTPVSILGAVIWINAGIQRFNRSI
jgi:hypothetical protein